MYTIELRGSREAPKEEKRLRKDFWSSGLLLGNEGRMGGSRDYTGRKEQCDQTPNDVK